MCLGARCVCGACGDWLKVSAAGANERTTRGERPRDLDLRAPGWAGREGGRRHAGCVTRHVTSRQKGKKHCTRFIPDESVSVVCEVCVQCVCVCVSVERVLKGRGPVPFVALLHRQPVTLRRDVVASDAASVDMTQRATLPV